MDDFAVRTRVWYRGALRSLLAWGAVAARTSGNGADCSAFSREMLEQLRGYRALRLGLRNGQSCEVSLDPEIAASDIAAATERLRALPSTTIWAGEELARARYDYVTLKGRRYLAVYARRLAEDAPEESLLLVDPVLLDQVFDLGEHGRGVNVALIAQDGGVVTSRGEGVDDSWLPAQDVDSARRGSAGRRRAALARAASMPPGLSPSRTSTSSPASTASRNGRRACSSSCCCWRRC